MLNIGVLGAANIARLFVAAVRPSTQVRIVAVGSRDVDKARAFALETQVPIAHGSYEALLADPEIDAIYNPLPNNLHAEWSIRAMQAGKHVLCEKPLCLSEADAVKMFEVSQRQKVYLAEGYPYRCQAQTMTLARLLKERAIGNLLRVHASFGFLFSATTSKIRLDPALGGGSLWDAGSYPVSLVRMIAGERPTRVHAFARWGDTGVDQTLIGSLEFAGGLLAQIACSFATVRHRRAILVGDAGMISTSYFNDTSAQMRAHTEVWRGVGFDAPRELIEDPEMPGFLAEADAFAALVREGWPTWPGTMPQESIDIAAMLEALARSAKSGQAVKLG